MTEQDKSHAMILALDALAQQERQLGNRGVACIIDDILALAPSASLARLYDAMKAESVA